MDKFENRSRQELIDLLRMYAGNAITIDGLWFSILEERIGLEETVKIDEEVWGRYAAVEARRIKQALNITGRDVKALAAVLDFQLWCSAPGFKYEITQSGEDRLTFIVQECRSQRGRILSGKGEYPCKTVNTAIFREIVREVNPDFEFRCVYCPPDPHPEDTWCRWEFQLVRGEPA
ncbi:MAG: hypothetical protein HPY50_21100 [Firmicutes bacterium]|nr:hypothetical protein [Bacillota bacterium]